ncbi:MAG TPA: hypothetical protein VGL28_10310 [Steroidobacteraceae bacterium]|jgi:hypothetical protein
MNDEERALDAALGRALRAPVPPADFRGRLHSAIARQGLDERGRAAHLARARRERGEQLQTLQADFVRLRRRTLGTLIGGAFAAGAAVAVALPLLQARFGADAMLVLTGLGALVGLIIGTASWISRVRIPNPLERL